MRMQNFLWVIGCCGSGKSSVGRALASCLGWNLLDVGEYLRGCTNPRRLKESGFDLNAPETLVNLACSKVRDAILAERKPGLVVVSFPITESEIDVMAAAGGVLVVVEAFREVRRKRILRRVASSVDAWSEVDTWRVSDQETVKRDEDRMAVVINTAYDLNVTTWRLRNDEDRPELALVAAERVGDESGG